MLFTSVTYYLFLAIVLFGFYALPWRYGRWLLIAASYAFYGTVEPWYCLLLLGSTLVDFYAALGIAAATGARARRALLLTSILLNLGLLGFFKYLDFGLENLNLVFEALGLGRVPLPHLLLPIGISFYTFQTLSYTIDVYRGRLAPTRDLAAFALYVAYFPQLVAGPIERARDLLPQLVEKQPVSRADIEAGFERILWGLVKKTVFADRLAVTVNEVYLNPAAYSSPELMLATACFSFQLYLDFSAYTDIAIGSARLMGVRLSENFNYPFLATNPSEFWSRWHITLTSWFRDYFYQSLGGTRRSQRTRTVFSVLLVMAVMGLWHGPEWHYVMFGLVSGAVLVGYFALRLTVGPRQARPSWWRTFLAIFAGNIVINIIMVFFRARDLPTAWQVLEGMATNGWGLRTGFETTAALLVFLWVVHILRGTSRGRRLLPAELSPPLRGIAWALLVVLLVYGAADESPQFIYFQF